MLNYLYAILILILFALTAGIFGGNQSVPFVTMTLLCGSVLAVLLAMKYRFLVGGKEVPVRVTRR